MARRRATDRAAPAPRPLTAVDDRPASPAADSCRQPWWAEVLRSCRGPSENDRINTRNHGESAPPLPRNRGLPRLRFIKFAQVEQARPAVGEGRGEGLRSLVRAIPPHPIAARSTSPRWGE